ncbi:HAD family hydrolase [Natrinema thermotolerans]|uniref:HAD family hydrolase n=1 Tax=Natrinema thermotolerans TaxID=121872 RepID=A0AAF0SYR5_9EURY|nr:HAD family hydrolase [Natrinema thermotolerans]QCC60369.1 HAD family hydrolase [Natrinema thermotolerans]QCC61276.1 HAD family hydrolase [Natrinema thermotolerans]WMT07396.1 HAD family hydrolase [Natrinema thermotolerans]WMT08028.1 HAD family hydrolase [Natrinema thermotolerans]
MERYDLVYRLYDEYDTKTLREYQEFVDVFPAVDSRVALEHWQEATEELEARKDEIRSDFAAGETFAEIAARATRDQAFTALDLETKYGRAVNVLVLDVDETLRSAGGTDNEIPRETLHLLTEFHDAGVPIVICTGQTLENVKGFAIQGLGSEIVHSGNLSIVYEAGTGVFTPGHGAATKQLLYEDLDETIRSVFDDVRSRVLPEAPEELRRGCHLQGNEFNVTMKPNYETGSADARDTIDEALVYLIDLLADAVGRTLEGAATDAGIDAAGESDGLTLDGQTVAAWTRAFYAAQDPEIRSVLESEGAYPDLNADDVPDSLAAVLERIDVAYYEADAAEIGSLELNKVIGVERALEVLGVDDPFALVMGDSKSDLRVMQWVADTDAGIAAAPEHASRDTLEHVLETDELVFDRGKSVDVLRTVYALNRLARLG